MFWLDVVSRIVHISTAIVLIGGSVFSLMVLGPALRKLPQDAADLMRENLGRWKMFVHAGILLFLVTGFYNYFRAMPNHKGDGLYHALVGTKILIAFGIFFVASALVGRSQGLAKMRENRDRWLTILVLLGAIIISMSGYLKIRGTVPAEAAPPPAMVDVYPADALE